MSGVPYQTFPPAQFWKNAASASELALVDFDFGKKFSFKASDGFGTAGSCFAQHFGRKLIERGGRVLFAETRHPLLPENYGHGYEVFSARYGNIYTTRQLLELLLQAAGLRAPIFDFGQRHDGRVVDMLRPRAVPAGFASEAEAEADRRYHLLAVQHLLRTLDVFVFTLGLTESWENAAYGYCYPIVPGAEAGQFNGHVHKFVNYSVAQVTADLDAICGIVRALNPHAKVMFTVSPVSLVATAEPRSVVVSTVASKSILRAAVDEVVRRFDYVDYFPSYEIITSPLTRGRFWERNCRDVTAEGVQTVMQVFFRSRFEQGGVAAPAPAAEVKAQDAESEILALLEADCDEVILDRFNANQNANRS